jgi:hypothetical protein
MYIQLETCHQHLALIKKKADTVNTTPEGRVNLYKINILQLYFLIFFVKSPVNSVLGKLLTHTIFRTAVIADNTSIQLYTIHCYFAIQLKKKQCLF